MKTVQTASKTYKCDQRLIENASQTNVRDFELLSNASVKLEVTLVTPHGAPRVLNRPVVEAGGGIVTVANSEHGVVHVLGRLLAVVGRVHTTIVISKVVDDLVRTKKN